MVNDKSWRLIGIFLLAAVLLNFPIIGIFDSNARLWGVPALYLYLFGIWGLLIILTWQTAERKAK